MCADSCLDWLPLSGRSPGALGGLTLGCPSSLTELLSGAWSCKAALDLSFALEAFIMAGGWLVFDNAQVLYQGGAVARTWRKAQRTPRLRKRRREAPR